MNTVTVLGIIVDAATVLPIVIVVGSFIKRGRIE